jgi:hypothetical protein
MPVAPGARRLPINLKPPARPAGSFLKEEFVELDEDTIVSWLSSSAPNAATNWS